MSHRQNAEHTINAEKPDDFYVVQIDLPLAIVKGASDAQCVGSTRTYAYRYMLMTALGVAEDDDPDKAQSGQPKNDKAKKPMDPEKKKRAEQMQSDDAEKRRLAKEIVEMKRRGFNVLQTGARPQGKWAYFDTDKVGGCVIELVQRF